MAKEIWKAGNMLYPVPPVLVSCRNKKGESNLLTVAWAGADLQYPSDAVHLRSGGALLASDDCGERRVCGQSSDREVGAGDG